MEVFNSVEKSIIFGSKILYFFFGGIQAGIAMPPFEFYKAADIINESKIFLRDFSQSWYHSGLRGISEDIDSTALYIEKEINEVNPEKVYFIGNSMGGYAAILFSTILGKGEVIAFAPQTFISSELRDEYNDSRWPLQISKALSLPMAKREAHDLRNLLLQSRSARKISIFVARDNAFDLAHAAHIKDCPRVHIFEFNTGGHSLVRELRDKGNLAQIMIGKYT